MKKERLLIVLFLTLLGWQQATADVVNPYKEDFNTPISTTAHDFAVDKGWGHVVDYYFDYDSYDTYYPVYTYSSTEGRDGTGALKAPDQTSVGDGWASGETTDLLVTPYVKGQSSIYVKRVGYSGTVRFYTVIEKNGSLIRSKAIDVELPELSTSEYVKVDIPRQDSTMIGIYASNVWIDDFEADSAFIVSKKALKLSNVTNVVYRGASNGNEDVDANGNFGIKFLVTLVNNGDVNFAPGDENYSLSIHNYNDSVVATVPITEPLAAGDTLKDYVLQTELPYAKYSKRDRYDVYENIGGTHTYGAWIEPVPYEPVVRVSDDNGSIDSGTQQAFGMINKAVTKNYTISDMGAAQLVVDSVIVPDGFTTTLLSHDTIAAHQSKDFTITATNDASGVHAGNMVLKIEGAGDFVLPLSATVLDSTKFYVNFEDGKFPQGFIAGDNWSVVQRDYGSSDNVYFAAASVITDSKLITPLLKVGEGEKMSFDAAKSSYYSNDSHLNVYYSTDRTNWTLAKTITSSDLPSETGSTGSYYYGKLRTFVLDSVPAGNYYIAFEAGYSAVDNIYGFERVDVDHDAFFKDVKLPTRGVVNNTYTATATLVNNNVKDETAGTYTTELLIDGKEVAADSSLTIKAGENADFSLSFVPHQTGDHQAVVLFRSGDYVAATDTVNVTIAPESARTEVQVGTVAGTSQSYVTPISVYYNYSFSDVIYTPTMLSEAGLKKGDKITRVSFKGYNTSGDVSADVKAWIGNTADTAYADSYVIPDTSRLTPVANANYTIPETGSDDDHQVLMAVDIPDGFIYDGQSIQMVMGSALTTTYKRAQFEYSTDNVKGFSKRSDSQFEWNTATAASYMPVPYFTVDRKPAKVAGKVSGDMGSVVNAHITLRNGDVYYETVSDSIGHYSMDVVQNDKRYAMTVTADGYLPYNDSISFDSMNVDKDIRLTLVPDTIVVPESGWTAYSNSHSVAFGDNIPEGLTLNAVIGVYENSAVTQEMNVQSQITAGVAVLIKAPAGTYVIPRVVELPTDTTANNTSNPYTNLLMPTADSAFTVVGSDSIYVLDTDADGTVGFRKATTGTVVPVHSAYLVITESDAREFYPLKDVVLTNIRNISTTTGRPDVTKPMYDLSGRRVSSSYKGVVVQSGRKYILR